MEEFARKIVMHIEALVSFCTTIHKVELAQFHLSRWQSIMREWTIISSVTLSLHIIYANSIHVLPMIIILRTTTISIIPNLAPGLILTPFVLATTTPCCKYAKALKIIQYSYHKVNKLELKLYNYNKRSYVYNI